jgi:hypothetical protein
LPPLTCSQFREVIGNWLLTHQFEQRARIENVYNFKLDFIGMIGQSVRFDYEMTEENLNSVLYENWLKLAVTRFKQSERVVSYDAIWLTTGFLMNSIKAILNSGFNDNAESNSLWSSLPSNCANSVFNENSNAYAGSLIRNHLTGMSILIVGDYELNSPSIQLLAEEYDGLIVFTNLNHFVAWFSNVPKMTTDISIYRNQYEFLNSITLARIGQGYGSYIIDPN